MAKSKLDDSCEVKDNDQDDDQDNEAVILYDNYLVRQKIKMMIKKMRHQSYCIQLSYEAIEKDDDQENEASVIRQAGTPLAHLEGNHRTKTCFLHGIFFQAITFTFLHFQIITLTVVNSVAW